MSSRLFRDSVPYRVDHIKSEISGIVFILPTLLILAFRHFRNFRIVFQSERFGIVLHWIASVTVLLYGSIIPQRDQVVQRNQGETGSRSPLLSLGFKSRVSILVYVLRFVCPLSDIEQQDFCHQLRFQSQFQFVVAYDGRITCSNACGSPCVARTMVSNGTSLFFRLLISIPHFPVRASFASLRAHVSDGIGHWRVRCRARRRFRGRSSLRSRIEG